MIAISLKFQNQIGIYIPAVSSSRPAPNNKSEQTLNAAAISFPPHDRSIPCPTSRSDDQLLPDGFAATYSSKELLFDFLTISGDFCYCRRPTLVGSFLPVSFSVPLIPQSLEHISDGHACISISLSSLLGCQSLPATQDSFSSPFLEATPAENFIYTGYPFFSR